MYSVHTCFFTVKGGVNEEVAQERETYLSVGLNRGFTINSLQDIQAFKPIFHVAPTLSYIACPTFLNESVMFGNRLADLLRC